MENMEKRGDMAAINNDKNLTGDMAAINKWVFFCFNYPYDFIEQIWGEEYICDHLKGKFQMYYDLVGSAGVMNKFYCNLSQEYQKQLMTWVLENYNGEPKL